MYKVDSEELFNRRGYVRVSKNLIFENPGTMRELFSNFFPIEISYKWNDTIEYMGVSLKFDKLEDNEYAPLYEATFVSISGCIILTKLEKCVS